MLLALTGFLVVLGKMRQDCEESSSVDFIDVSAAFPPNEAIHSRVRSLFAGEDIEEWMKLLPHTLEVEEVVEDIFMLVEGQLNLLAEVGSLKSRKDAFALLFEEKQQLLTEERKRNRESELEKAGLKEVNEKQRCEVEQLQKVVAKLSDRVKMLLGNLEHSKKELAAKVNQTEIALKEKWELERQELVLRVSELEAALAQQGATEEHLVHSTDSETEGVITSTDSGMAIYWCNVLSQCMRCQWQLCTPPFAVSAI